VEEDFILLKKDTLNLVKVRNTPVKKEVPLSLELEILTLMIDLQTQKELLTYYTANNLTWNIGSINMGNYSKIHLPVVPSFFLFNSTSVLVKQYFGLISFELLLDFIEIS
jgi:hypothetical protein